MTKIYNYWHEKGIPYFKPIHFVVGNFGPCLLGKKSWLALTEEVYKKFPNDRYVGFYEFTTPILIIRDPELIKDITIKDFDSFPNHRRFVSSDIDPLWGKGLFQMSTREGWHSMRSTLSPFFTGSKLKMLFTLMGECATQFIDHIKSQNGEMIEIKDTYTRFSNDIIATCAFGIQCDSLKHRENEFYVMGREASDFSGIRGLRFFIYDFSATLMKIFDIKIFSNRVSAFFRKIIKEALVLRREKNIIRPDMLHLLIEAAKKINNLDYEERMKNVLNEFTDEDITAQVITFFIAGFETISTALCYLTYYLAINPDVQKRLYDEINETLEESPKTTYETLTSMKYLECVISESLRINTPVGIVNRRCEKPYTIKPVNPTEKPVELNKGSIIWFPAGALQKDEKYFPNPDRFDPERFNAENKSKINPFAYIPFGSGPRNCVGTRFATLEMKTIIVEILKHFEIVPNAKTEIPLVPSPVHFNGLPDGGMWLDFKPRT
ncbi:hypothetical protein FQA39_LY15400 [Lamprigera yunnana]|nr:hypothetical protein FQA39_LY15400 [Lamprigera yunnana]